MNEIDYAELRNKALTQLRSGEPLFGKNGAFAPLLKEFLETALSAEMDSHLTQEERSMGNKRNGKGQKTLKTLDGAVQIDTPEDRFSTFRPSIVKKREVVLTDNLSSKIIGLYGLGMSMRDISSHISEMYNVDISHTTISEITDKIIPKVEAWQCRPLESVYPIVFLDAMHYKVRSDGRVENRAVYNVLGVNSKGKKELIGMYVSKNEGAGFWLSVLNNLKARGLKDILIACIDNLNGFAEAIATVYPEVEIQSCIVHQIRNSLKYVGSKNQKEFLIDLKRVYQSPTKLNAELELDKLEDKWGKIYPVVITSWRKNWEKLSAYFEYDAEIRKVIYTTNAVEGFHRQIRKVTKTKGVFPNDNALLKLIYLATMNISKKWVKSIPNWGLLAQQFRIKFGERMPLDL